jgi:NAD(P)-dependent dehydrogenase (short-subunit alcohol dehydrogenase family)
MDLEGRNALVTGAANGIGRAIALALADAGANIAVADVDEAGAEKVVAEVAERGRRSIAIRTDVTQRDQVEAMVARTIADLGCMDVLVNNAGVAVQGPVEKIPLDDWEWIMAINLWSHIWALRVALPHMKERGSGHIVHTASAAGVMPSGWALPYGTTKFAVVGLASNLALALKGTGIGVSVICPLFVATDIMDRARTTLDEGDARSDAVVKQQGTALVKSVGIPPEIVGQRLVEAIREDSFWVFPHPELTGIMQQLWADPNAYMANAGPAIGETLSAPAAQ